MARIGIAALVLTLLGADGVLDADPDPEESRHEAGPEPECPGPSLALVDLGRALKECRYFREQMAALKADVAAANERTKRKVEETSRLTKETEDLTAETSEGETDERKPGDPAGMPDSAELREEIYAQRRAFLNREARIYSTIRQELSKQVEDYCRENGIGIVMRVEDEEMDPSKPGSVLRVIQRRLVWYGPEIPDITDDVIERFDAHVDEDGASGKVSSNAE